MNMKKVAIGDFLTEAQIKRACELKKAKDICDEIIRPNIALINAKLGQENDPMYLSYMVEYVVSLLNQPQSL
jgi:hypothetical protein